MAKSAPATCDVCGFRLVETFAQLRVSDLGFVSDDRFPGRCIVMLRQHATELYDLNSTVRHAFADDVSAAALAIKQAVNAFKMNYEILGNADAHVHCHLIPRQLEEPKPKAPAWLHPQAQNELATEEAEEVKRRIVTHLGPFAEALKRRPRGAGRTRSGSGP